MLLKIIVYLFQISIWIARSQSDSFAEERWYGIAKLNHPMIEIWYVIRKVHNEFVILISLCSRSQIHLWFNIIDDFIVYVKFFPFGFVELHWIKSKKSDVASEGGQTLCNYKGVLIKKVTGKRAVIRSFPWSFTEFIALDNKVTNFCDSLAILWIKIYSAKFQNFVSWKAKLMVYVCNLHKSNKIKNLYNSTCWDAETFPIWKVLRSYVESVEHPRPICRWRVAREADSSEAIVPTPLSATSFP